MSNPILQFGTSRFLQAHVDLFVARLRAQPPKAIGGHHRRADHVERGKPRAHRCAARDRAATRCASAAGAATKRSMSRVECDAITEAPARERRLATAAQAHRAHDVRNGRLEHRRHRLRPLPRGHRDLLDGQRTPRGARGQARGAAARAPSRGRRAHRAVALRADLAQRRHAARRSSSSVARALERRSTPSSTIWATVASG